MPERNASSHHSLLVEKRCEVYSRAASIVMDLEEAFDGEDGLRARYLLQDLRRTLRSALAFLTDEVYRELERLEALGELLPSSEGPVPAGAERELRDRLQLLHVKLARSLQLPYLQDMEQIVGLPTRLKYKLVEESREQDLQRRQQELEEQCWQFESEARTHMQRKDYDKAIKSLRKAVRLDPTRAVFHNDLGVMLSLLGRAEEAVEEYRTAAALNEAHPEQRTDEWATSYYNLGIALRRSAQEALGRGDGPLAVERLEEARIAFGEYTKLNATGAKVQDARDALEQVATQIERLQSALAEAEQT